MPSTAAIQLPLMRSASREGNRRAWPGPGTGDLGLGVSCQWAVCCILQGHWPWEEAFMSCGSLFWGGWEACGWKQESLSYSDCCGV